MRWTADGLASAAGGRVSKRSGRPIAGAFIDSRAPVHDALFVPIVAARDGHDFINHAIAGGASAIVQRPGGELPQVDVTVVEVEDTLAALHALARDARARVEGPVVAITGSNGKTTTRAMVTAALQTGYARVLCTHGNLNNHLGVPLTLLSEPHDPDAMVIELGMNAAGENDALAQLVEPTVAIVTGVALEHLEFLGSIEAIARAEAEVLAHVRPGGMVVLPCDEPLLEAEIPAEFDGTVVRFGPGPDAEVRIETVTLGIHTIAQLVVAGEPVDVRLQSFGAHNARNAAAALAVGHQLGLSPSAMAEALSAVEPVGDRGRVHVIDGHMVIADCYNANPGSVASALRSLAALRLQRPGPLIAVLGDMLELGPSETQLHAEAGALAAELGLDAVCTVGPISRHLASAAAGGGIESHHFGDDPDAAVAWVRDRLDGVSPGAVLVKASRGMRFERVVDGLIRASQP